MKSKSIKDIAGLLSQYQQPETVSIEVMNESIQRYLQQQHTAESENQVSRKIPDDRVKHG